jgi:phage terminase small subunit
MKIPKPPKSLKSEGRAFWRKVLSEFDLQEAHDLERLSMAGKCLDDLSEAEKRVETDGMFTTNRYGSTVEHPGLRIIRDSRALFLKIIREACLDVTSGDSRPPRRY